MVKLLTDEHVVLQIPLEEIRSLQEMKLPGANLAQRPLVERQVVSLQMSDPASWPEVLVTRIEEGWLMVDGYHRWEAARRLGLTALRATARPFASEQEVIEAAFQANLHHGLPSSANNRSAYAYWLFCTYPDLPQTEIAQRVGVKPSTVNVAIKRRMREHQESEERSKRRTAILWRQETQEEKDLADARDKQIAKDIRAYVRISKRLYDDLSQLGDGVQRYRALDENIAEEERVPLWRMASYMQRYVKESLPPDLVASLSPSQPRSRSRSRHATKTEDAGQES